MGLHFNVLKSEIVFIFVGLNSSKCTHYIWIKLGGVQHMPILNPEEYREI